MNQPPFDNRTKKSFLSGTSPKASFVLGLAVGVAAISLVGFVTLLVTTNREDRNKVAGVSDSKVNTNKTTTNTNTNTIPTPSPAVDIELKDITDEDHIRGDKNASVTLVEFSDFQCPYCSRVYPTMNALLEKYDGKIRIVYKHFPLISIHEQAVPAAEASECAAEQGKFWEFHDAIFENQSKLASGYYSELSSQLGLNQSQFDNCVSSRKYQQKVADQLAEATAAGAQGTPYTVVIDAQGKTTPIKGAYPQSTFEAVIEQAL